VTLGLELATLAPANTLIQHDVREVFVVETYKVPLLLMATPVGDGRSLRAAVTAGHTVELG